MSLEYDLLIFYAEEKNITVLLRSYTGDVEYLGN